MDKVGSDQAAKVLKKGKKKQAKDELDRQKQAEKKRRRLEKALANSAAIISELEKKKQKKKEEQQRLDEEGAAIAEAVALHVLIGEDSVEPCHLMPNKHRRCDHWDYSAGFGLTPDLQGIDSYSPGLLTHIGHAHGSKGRWTNWGIGQPFPHWGQVRDLQAPFCQGTFEQSKTCLGGDCQAPYFQETFQQSNTCPGFLAAQAVSSLQIRENSSDDIFPSQGPAAAIINRMLGNRLNLYREL